jgi:hypothetical protein
MRNRKYDYMKYYRVIRYFVKAKYNISQPDLDILFFLYSEGYFTIDRFLEFDRLVNWDNKRFKRLRSEGWIENFRKPGGGQKGLYEISHKGKRLIDSIYKKLEGEELPSTAEHNPLYRKRVKSTDKIYKNFIERMNKELREMKAKGQRLRPSPE